MEAEAALERELQSQLSSLERKGRIYFGTYTYAVLPPFTRAVVEKVGIQIHHTCCKGGYRVEELGFCSCTFGEGGLEALQEFLSQSQSAAFLESLVFSAVSNMNHSQIARLVQACHNLRMLKISMIAPGIELNIVHPHLVGTGGSIAQLMYSARNLEVLDLMGLETDQMDDFAKGLTHLHKLRELHISLKDVAHQHVNATLDSLLHLSLDSLDMRLNPPASDGSYDQGCLERLTRLLNKGVLKSLILASIPSLFEIPSHQPDTLVQFYDELRSNNSLRRLELGHTLGVAENEAVAIFRALEENSRLSRFSWNTACMLEKAWGQLLKSIPKMNHLSELTFSAVGDRVAPLDEKLKSQILSALRQNTSLTNFRYEREFDVFATDRAGELLELAKRNSLIGRARVAVQAAMVGDDDNCGNSEVLNAKAHLCQRLHHTPRHPCQNTSLGAFWKDSYWPMLMTKWGSRRESTSALYYIVQCRAVHWIENAPPSRPVFKIGKRPCPFS
ncbi:hypothetical protein ACA910_020730 [Epithemia clementina (nom. ined.)]